MPADRLRQHDPGRDRIAERRQRDAAAADNRSRRRHHRAPPHPRCPGRRPRSRSAAIRPGAAVAEVRAPVGQHVVEPAADQTERHRPQRDVVDDPGLAAAGRPTPVADEQRGDDAGDDEQRVGADRDRTRGARPPAAGSGSTRVRSLSRRNPLSHTVSQFLGQRAQCGQALRQRRHQRRTDDDAVGVGADLRRPARATAPPARRRPGCRTPPSPGAPVPARPSDTASRAPVTPIVDAA